LNNQPSPPTPLPFWERGEIMMLKKTFKIPDMTCSNCVMKIESLEDDLEGVKQVNASYHRLEMVIEFDEFKLSDEQIIAAVKKKGYQAIPL
jgi:copper chaperone CopZ